MVGRGWFRNDRDSTLIGSRRYRAGVNRLALLLVPAVFAVLALSTGRLPFKLGVPGLCALILLESLRSSPGLPRREIGAVVIAFGMSMVGDYFLSTRSGRAHYFEAGIVAFFFAHLGYLRYALYHGRLHRGALTALLAMFVPYFGFILSPAIDAWTLWVAVLAYLLISCVALAAALGMKASLVVKGLYVAGIGLVVLSDTIISFNEFLRYRAFNAWILPTYYLAHLSITASILWRSGRGSPSDRAAESIPTI